MQQPLFVSGKRLTLEQWLENMELSQFQHKFCDMRLGELLSYTQQDIEDLCQAFEIKMPFKKRVSDAIHVLQANKSNIDLPLSATNDSTTTPRHRVGGVARSLLSVQEEQALDAMDERYQEVVQSLTDSQSSIETLKANHAKCKKQINDTFDELTKTLNNRRAQLIERLNFEGNRKMTAIKHNKQRLLSYKESIERCQEDAHKMAMDVTMDKKTRKSAVLQMQKYVQQYAQQQHVQLSSAKDALQSRSIHSHNFLKFDCKSETGQKALSFVSTFGNILLNEEPMPPVVSLIGVGITRCQIQFAVNPDSNACSQPPTHWIVEYKLWFPPKATPKPKPRAKSTKSETKAIDDEKMEEAEQQISTDELDLDAIGSESQWTPKAKLENTNQYVLDGLQANTKYEIRVCCGNEHGWSEYSQRVSVFTKPIEGGVDSKILSLKEKKSLLKLLADRFNVEMTEKVMTENGTGGVAGSPHKKQKSSFLETIFGGNKKNEYVNEENISLQLLYRGSRDGFEAHKFHEKCDSMEDTLVIVEVAENRNVFGGFTRAAWKSPRSFQFASDKSAFLFSVRNKAICGNKQKAQIYPIKATDVEYAICRDAKYGPIFGNGYSVCIYDRCNEADTNYANAISFGFREQPNQLTDTHNFTVHDYECFMLSVK